MIGGSMIYLVIYLTGVIAAAIVIYLYEKKWINEGLDYTLSELLFDVVTTMTSWFGFIAVFLNLFDDIVIIKGKRK